MKKERIIIDYLGKKKNVSLSVKKGKSLIYILLGFKPGDKNITVNLNGEDAEARILGAIIGKNGKVNINTFQHHRAPNTKSDLLINGVFLNQTSYKYEGLIKIDPKAQKSNAYQKNNNLLLSDRAHVDTSPKLEILADDVRCTHGATVGRIDEEELFYLMSRGIPKKDAEKLVISGFLKSIVADLVDRKIKQKIESILEREVSKII
ncbi:MAG: SufD family Fe-S cluster assembly protein [Patescibacteria group bacterium]|jgi:Fe-S cluster assembly protein SufD